MRTYGTGPPPDETKKAITGTGTLDALEKTGALVEDAVKQYYSPEGTTFLSERTTEAARTYAILTVNGILNGSVTMPASGGIELKDYTELKGSTTENTGYMTMKDFLAAHDAAGTVIVDDPFAPLWIKFVSEDGSITFYGKEEWLSKLIKMMDNSAAASHAAHVAMSKADGKMTTPRDTPDTVCLLRSEDGTLIRLTGNTAADHRYGHCHGLGRYVETIPMLSNGKSEDVLGSLKMDDAKYFTLTRDLDTVITGDPFVLLGDAAGEMGHTEGRDDIGEHQHQPYRHALAAFIGTADQNGGTTDDFLALYGTAATETDHTRSTTEVMYRLHRDNRILTILTGTTVRDRTDDVAGDGFAETMIRNMGTFAYCGSSSLQTPKLTLFGKPVETRFAAAPISIQESLVFQHQQVAAIRSPMKQDSAISLAA